MPKEVDHHARRLVLLDAMWRITRRDGWDAISLRKLAAEADVSMGLVQHYFNTKDEMLRFATEMMAEDTRQRIRHRVTELAEPISPRTLVETALNEMIPDADRRDVEAEAAEVWVRRFLLRPESRAMLNQGLADVRAFLAEQITLAGKTNAELDADGLIALIDGLNYDIVAGSQTAASAKAILRAQLDCVFLSHTQAAGE